jgi:hypothetical protein
VSLSNTGITSLPPNEFSVNGTAALGRLDLSGSWNLSGPIPFSWGARLPNTCLLLHNTSLCGRVPNGLQCFRKDATRLGARATAAPVVHACPVPGGAHFTARAHMTARLRTTATPTRTCKHTAQAATAPPMCLSC